MFSDFVVVVPPSLDDGPSIVDRGEPVLVEAFVAEPPVEALHVAVLVRLSRLNEVQSGSVLFGPDLESAARELRPVVADDRFWPAATLAHELGQHPRDQPARDRALHSNRQTLPGAVVDDVERSKAGPATDLIGGEVHRPALVRLGWGRRLLRSANEPLTCTLSHLQPLLAVEPVDLLVVDHHASSSQPATEPLVSVPRQFGRQCS